ncbi:MAG: hypothetical protein R3229_04125 [Alphaproteobacteria bacterium]|nr:hypothetical protein [Alphaproteobacteria bacterium]
MTQPLSRRPFLAALGAGVLTWALAPAPAPAAEGKRRVVSVTIRNRRVIAPKGPIRVTQGDLVELRWRSDERVELHLHGYDKTLDLRPGSAAKLVFRARVAGRFPVTSHGWGAHGHGHQALTYLEVYPR